MTVYTGYRSLSMNDTWKRKTSRSEVHFLLYSRILRNDEQRNEVQQSQRQNAG